VAVVLPPDLATGKLSHALRSVTQIKQQACVHRLIPVPPQFQTQPHAAPLIETPDAFGAEIAAETGKRKKVVVFVGLKVE